MTRKATAKACDVESRPTVAKWLRPRLPVQSCIGKARQDRLLDMADVGAHEKSRARRVPRFERLYDVVTGVRRTFGEFPAHICDSPAQLDLQGEPRQSLDKSGVSGLPGDRFVKFPVSHGVCFNIALLQRDHRIGKHVFESSYIVIAHLRYGEFDRKT